jgi:hypothetical protein
MIDGSVVLLAETITLCLYFNEHNIFRTETLVYVVC